MSEQRTEYKFYPTPPKVIALTGEQYDKLLAEAREQEREQCCKDVCLDCRYGIPVTRQPDGTFRHTVEEHHDSRCEASRIRRRAAKEQAG